MAMRKRKEIEANDGSYAGMVLAAFDRLEVEATARRCGECSRHNAECLGMLADDEADDHCFIAKVENDGN